MPHIEGPTLVMLAAGMGSRYGGLKQLERLGPGGETIMDYSIFDAIRAGFGRVVFVIRPDIERAFLEYARGRFGGRIEVATALQRLDEVPAGFDVPSDRAKPWGTGQAVLVAEPEVDGPFGVLNADDFYGRRGLDVLGGFVRGEAAGGGGRTWAVIGYPLGDTVSEAGGVNRGVLRADEASWLREIEEVLEIHRVDHAFEGSAASGAERFAADTLVSMNLWGFTPLLFQRLRDDFRTFLEAGPGAKRELLLPEVVADAISDGAARVRVLPADSEWCGVTYPEDRPRVESKLRQLVAEGHYPPRLWD